MNKNIVEPLLQEDVSRYVMFPIKDQLVHLVIDLLLQRRLLTGLLIYTQP